MGLLVTKATTALVLSMALLGCAGGSGGSPAVSLLPTPAAPAGVPSPSATAAGAVSTLKATPAVEETRAPQRTASPVPASPSASRADGPAVDVAGWFRARSPKVDGQYATTDVSHYGRPNIGLATVPAVSRPVELSFAGSSSLTQVPNPRALAGGSTLVVRGRPLAFSRPYFNSADGSFWHRDFVEAKGDGGVTFLLRDVLFQVDEVLAGRAAGVAPGGTVDISTVGGAAVITVAPDVIPADSHFEPGTHLWTEATEVDLAVGEEVVLFLATVELDGLYAEGGRSYGYRSFLMPSHPSYYKFSFRDGSAVNETLPGGPYSLTLDEIREFGTSGWLGSSAAQPDQNP